MRRGDLRVPESFLDPVKGAPERVPPAPVAAWYHHPTWPLDPMSDNCAIETIALSKRYGSVQALEGLDLSVARGGFFGLLGRNGSGKTTTLHILSTLVRPSAGQAHVAGFDVVRAPVAVRRGLGVVFQESALDRNLTVLENLLFAGALAGLPERTVRQRSMGLLALLDLGERCDSRVASLSGGMRRAVDIARGVLHRPPILLLDEPTIGLDVINRRLVWYFLQRLREEEGTTLVLCTHYMEEAEACAEVAFMRAGRVIGQGQPAALCSQLAAFILELESDTPAAIAHELQPTLGVPLTVGDRMQFRVLREAFALTDLPPDLKARVRALVLRRPGLEDVYLWLNRDAGGR